MHIRMRSIPFAKQVRTVIASAILLASASYPFLAGAAPASPPVRPAAPPARVIAQITTARGETVSFRIGADGAVYADGTFAASRATYSPQANRQKYATPLDLLRAVAPNVQPPLTLIEANARVISYLQHTPKRKPTAVRAAQSPSFSHGRRPMDATDDWFVYNYCYEPVGPNVCYTNAYSWAYFFDQSVSYGYANAFAKTGPLTFAVNSVGSWNVPQGTGRWVQKWAPVFTWFGSGDFTWDAAVSGAQLFDFASQVGT